MVQPMERDSATAERLSRRKAIGDARRNHIVEAARRLVEADGVEGASLRAIAAEAGYTPAALYFHFPSKEAIQVELLERSLARVAATVRRRIGAEIGAAERFAAGARAFYDVFAERPCDLDLALHLLRGGLKPAGLGPAEEARVTAALAALLAPLAEAAEGRGYKPKRAHLMAAEAFAHAVGLLLISKAGRVRSFDASTSRLMDRYLDARLDMPGGH